MTPRNVLAIAVMLYGCFGSSEPRFRSSELGFAANQPDGWKASLARGVVEFRSEDLRHAKHTIVVRSAIKPREIREGTIATIDDIVATTEKVLRALPQSEVLTRATVPHAKLPATRFTLTFRPRDVSSRYSRDHIVLVGNHHLFHVMYTAPVGEVPDDDAMKKIVMTLVEEG